MDWIKFKKRKENLDSFVNWQKEATNIRCPVCGEYLFKDTSIIYATMPPKYKYFCDKCGWSDVC